MPIYEFYCRDCHTLFNFLSQKIDTETRPPCPKCEEAILERRPARFAALVTRTDGGQPGEDFGAGDEARMERVMESMVGELEGMGDEEDPRTMARLFRRFGEAGGMEPRGRMEEILQRMEAGEDPDRLEEELGDAFEDEDSLEELFRLKRQGGSHRRRRPQVDDTLYFF